MINSKGTEKIKNTSRTLIADVLGCSISQAGKFKRGFSCLSNTQALALKEQLDLEPEAFEEIHSSYKKNKEKK